MKKKFKCVLLIDDQEDSNFLHKRTINSIDCTEKVEVALNGKEAIDFLKSKMGTSHPQPEIIFLDLNMPVMDGWEFLEEYDKLEEQQKAGIVIVMLTTSLNPKDQERAIENKYVKEFVSKYLDESGLMSLIQKYFSDYL
ncbi:MAG: response regulator [Cyclobacteriaceae bacterium]